MGVHQQRLAACFLFLTAFLLLLPTLHTPAAGQELTDAPADASGGPSDRSTVNSPLRIGGNSGQGDERDADIYPAVAFNAAQQRYLAVWLSATNAGSSSDGFDLFGVFLDTLGRPSSSAFRISDDNNVARNGLPAVVAGHNGFVVAWTGVNSGCRLYIQQVNSSSSVADTYFVNSGQHSPSIAYNPQQQRYVVAYVDGTDYLPPTFFGSDTADCGNSATSTSSVRAFEFAYSGASLTVTRSSVTLSTANGAFRPRIDYSPALAQYVVAWEDRRNAAGQAYRFDVYGQRLTSSLTLNGSNLALDTGYSYQTDGTSATWTPRPVVAASESGFLTAWFRREQSGPAVIWKVQARLLGASGSSSIPLTVASSTFAANHSDQPPYGYLAADYSAQLNEYFTAYSGHLESIWGYFSYVRLQRITPDGTLRKLDGTTSASAGIGTRVDVQNEDQIAAALAVNPNATETTSDALVLYAKHLTGQHSQDLDVFGARVNISPVYLPAYDLFLSDVWR